MLQLIDYGVHIMLPKGKEMVGVQNVIEKFGIPPQSLCDYQALMGDAVVSSQLSNYISYIYIIYIYTS